jgi:hypothetical protein
VSKTRWQDEPDVRTVIAKCGHEVRFRHWEYQTLAEREAAEVVIHNQDCIECFAEWYRHAHDQEPIRLPSVAGW